MFRLLSVCPIHLHFLLFNSSSTGAGWSCGGVNIWTFTVKNTIEIIVQTLPRDNWKIVESGVKHHKPINLNLHFNSLSWFQGVFVQTADTHCPSLGFKGVFVRTVDTPLPYGCVHVEIMPVKCCVPSSASWIFLLVEVTGVPTGLPYITDIRLYQLHLYFLSEGCYSIKTYMAGLNHFICGWLKHFIEGKCRRKDKEVTMIGHPIFKVPSMSIMYV